MKAIVIHHYGPPDVLKYENVPDPSRARAKSASAFTPPPSIACST